MRGIIYFLLFLLLCAVSILFFAQNDQPVTLSYFVGQSDVPLAYIIVAAVIIGYLVGLLSFAAGMLKQTVQLKSYKRQLISKSKELENLRSMPVRDDF
ncbi:MAG: LapA family protein [Kangiellaceae bacterium]|jgi:putative membrane protein|nr:LapA family protein [Kangiellaceae bacterium]